MDGEEGPGEGETTTADAAALAAVSVKLPPFWPSDQEVWFAQLNMMKSSYLLKQIKQQMK